jgi:hypothetical protein
MRRGSRRAFEMCCLWADQGGVDAEFRSGASKDQRVAEAEAEGRSRKAARKCWCTWKDAVIKGSATAGKGKSRKGGEEGPWLRDSRQSVFILLMREGLLCPKPQ